VEPGSIRYKDGTMIKSLLAGLARSLFTLVFEAAVAKLIERSRGSW
jgi:hypothetical protein